MTTTLITGNTYPVGEAIKALGGRWNKAAQGWDVPTDRAEEAQALVNGAGESTYHRRADSQRGRYNRQRYVSNYTRFSSGAEVFTNKRGRCEDAPCCGCCS